MDLFDAKLIESAEFLGHLENGSDAWHAARNEFGAIGGSEIGTICGFNRWESAVTLFYKKTGKIPNKIEPSHRMRMGTKFEEPLLEIFAEDHPEFEVYKTGTYAWKQNLLNRANPDSIAIDKSTGELVLLEVKFSGDNMYEIPLSYKAQMQFYMGILGIRRGILVACAGSNYTELPLEFDQFEFDTLCQMADEFRAHLEADVRPDFDGSDSTYETMRAINPDINPDESVELGDLGMHLRNAYTDLQESEAKYKELQSRVLYEMELAKWGLYYDERIVYRTSRNGGKPYLAWSKK